MNNLISLIKDNIISYNISSHETKIENATIELQNANDKSVVFYNLNDSKDSLLLLKERLKKASYGLLIIATDSNIKDKIENTILVNKSNFLETQKIIIDCLYPEKSTSKLIGITGTNGKTTTAILASQIARSFGFKALAIGTLGIFDGENYLKSNFKTTSPSYVEVRKIISSYSDVDFIFFEVSSHALVQERFYKISFDIVAWTTFGIDHLDYHKTVENYFLAKSELFKNKLKVDGVKIVNTSDETLREYFYKYKEVFEGSEIVQEKSLSDKLPLFFNFKYNFDNLQISLSIVSRLLKKDLDINSINLDKLKTPLGRLMTYPYLNGYIVVDFAHTPDALDSILSVLFDRYGKSKIMTVFGCGGNRDRSKRELMGKVVSKYCDRIYVTSDNPRNENPLEIIEDIKTGLSSIDNSFFEVNRFDCITKAFSDFKEGDILLVAGKGHEDYQEFENGRRVPYSDISTIEKLLGIK